MSQPISLSKDNKYMRYYTRIIFSRQGRRGIDCYLYFATVCKCVGIKEKRLVLQEFLKDNNHLLITPAQAELFSIAR